jgi:hypothetical protein
MKDEIKNIQTEIAELTQAQGDKIYSPEIKEVVEYRFVTGSEEETQERQGSISDTESVPFDYDYDIDSQTDFDLFITIKYYWNDWNPIVTDIF